MQQYTAPLNQIRFIQNMLGAGDVTKEMNYEGYDWGTMCQFMDMVADFATNEMLPLNESGDREGCTHDKATKKVKTPKGFARAYKQFAEMGLCGVTGSQEYGGLGAPYMLNAAIVEFCTATNFSLATYGGLTAGCAKAVEYNGTDELKTTFLPKLSSGEWTGTMCLTEQQAGTDLGMLKTKAEPIEGTDMYAITGEKIFISCGEHDVAGNICHLVLARTPDAPQNIKGISLFLVPKFMPDAKGEIGEANSLHCSGLWEKMGIHGSSTCTMQFDGAKGWLVGEKNKGVNAMFTMMNDARMKVGLQGLGIADIAVQNAIINASLRKQGSLIKDARDPNAPKAPSILHHTNVRADLIDLQSMIQGFRALLHNVAKHQDIAARFPEEQFRQQAEDYVALMTPIIKSMLTDISVEASIKGIQIPGGAGFITESGVEQFFRDAIIGTIYEGTNHIQAMDFVFRKALDPKDFQSRIGQVLEPLSRDIFNAYARGQFVEEAQKLENCHSLFEKSMTTLALKGLMEQLDDMLAVSKDFIDMFGYLATGKMWLQMMNAAQGQLDDNKTLDAGQKQFYETQVKMGRAYIHRVMTPRIKMLESKLEAGAETVVAIEPDELMANPDVQIGIEQWPAPEPPHPDFRDRRILLELMMG
jgi:alkylation response protein AidB-like acyl-CoA dehydrogenase